VINKKFTPFPDKKTYPPKRAFSSKSRNQIFVRKNRRTEKQKIREIEDFVDDNL